MRALVISGGGCKGGFPIGYESVNRDNYNLYCGSSTGVLACLMIAQGKYNKGIEFYGKVTNNLVYDENPFNKKGQLKELRALTGFLQGKGSFATTTKLLTLIRENYSKFFHETTDKEIVVAVSNLTTNKVEYKSSKNLTWSVFTYWCWVSTLATPYTGTAIVNNNIYADGGFEVSLPLKYACERGATNIRAIALTTKESSVKFRNNNVVNVVLSVLDTQLDNNLRKDIELGLEYRKHGVAIDLIYMPEKMTDKAMHFAPKTNKKIIELGIKTAQEKI
jgi:NTE family protein